ncbi:hypothetical protein [Pseudomonas luteola]|uniref:Uncharacterized protein n=1 Tax=Pseudomonas luteola TaxID=47886 RepID=A0ABS0MXT0_PSELU|nr:hypothetical protein [Pseudomonas luteola]MBH3440557.1 hypothetical protein [Pseudomonas luteola]
MSTSIAEWERLANDQHALVRFPEHHTSYMEDVADRLLSTGAINKDRWSDMMEVIESAKLWAAEALATYSPDFIKGGIYELRDMNGKLAGIVEQSGFEFYNLSEDHGVVRRNPNGRLEFHERNAGLYGSVDEMRLTRKDGQQFDLVFIRKVIDGEEGKTGNER